MLRRLAVLVVGFTAAGLVTATPAFAAAPTVTALSPTSGPVDTLLTISGTGFTTTATVKVGGVVAGSVVKQSSTRLTARVPLTATGPVVVTTPEGQATGPVFTVTPGAVVTPTVVRPSGSATVSGSGFAAREAVDVYVDTTAAALVVSSGTGTFTAAVATARTTTPGAHTVTAVGRRSGSAAQVTLTVRTDWTSPGFDAGRTGTNPYEQLVTTATVDDLGQRWSGPYVDTGYAPPSVVGGVVVFHTYLDDVIAVDATTGVERWRVDLSDGDATFGGAVVASGVVYVGAADGHVYALSLATGAQKWRASIDGPVLDTVVVSGGSVFVPTRSGLLFALDAATGTERWAAGFDSGVVPRTPTVAGGWLYVGTSGDTVRRIDAATGASSWEVAVGGEVFAGPIVADGRVFAATVEGRILALRLTNGSVFWSATVGTGVAVGAPALVGGRLIVSNTQPVTTAYDYVTGDVLWTRSGVNGGYSPVTTAGGVAYVGNATGTLAYDVHTGAVLRRLALAAQTGGVVIVDGAVYGYDADHSVLERWDLVAGSPGSAGAARPTPARPSPAA